MRQSVHSLFYLLTAVVLLTACAEEKVYKIGVSQCSAGQWREKVNNEMLAAQHLYEQDVDVVITCAYDDTERQIRQIDSLANSGIDLLVVAPNEEAPVSDAISRIRKRGIPVICFDRKVEDDNYTAFIGGSNVEAGKKKKKNAVDVAKGMVAHGYRPLVLEITATMSSSPAKERHQGFSEAMKGHPELDYIWRSSDWSSEGAYRIAKEQIETGHLPDIVFCHNDGMATGVYKAVVETHTEGKVKIMGIDGMPDEGLEYVEFGHQIASYVYPTGGAEIVRLALDILTGKPYKQENTLQGILVVRENVWPISTTTKELMKQQRDLITVQDKLEDSLALYDTQHKVLIGSMVTIVVLVVAMIIFHAVNSTSVIDAIYIMVSYTYGPLLGLFAYGLFTRRAVCDRCVPCIAIASPLLCYAVDSVSASAFGYKFGYELLLLNGTLTFVGLLLTSRISRN